MAYNITTHKGIIPLGKVGENQYTSIDFDVSPWLSEYPTGIISAIFSRPDGNIFPVPIYVTGTVARWLITNVEVEYAGIGEIQLTMTVGDTVAKSMIFKTKTERSLDTELAPPLEAKNWVEELIEASATALEAAQLAKTEANAATSAAQRANTAAANVKDGTDGKDGKDGADGTSATHSWNGTTLTITSASGTSSADLKGEKGDNGDPYILTEADKEEIIAAVPAVYYTSQNLTEEQKAQARANIGATAGEDVEFAESLEWLSENGDTSKKYVLPDGYIYEYGLTTVEVLHNANDGTGFLNIRPTASSGSNKDDSTTKNGLFTTAPIEVDGSWSDCIINISGLEKLVPTFYGSLYVYYFDKDGTFITYVPQNIFGLSSTAGEELALPISFDAVTKDASRRWSDTAYIRVAVGVHLSAAITDSDIEGLVINIDRLNTTETAYGWNSTGRQHSNDKATQQNSADIATLKEQLNFLRSGAKWYAIGDSITYGLYSTSASDYYQPVIGQRWVDFVAQYSGYELTNLGKSGTGFVTGTTFRTIVDGNDFANADLVTIMLGINDWKSTEAVNKVGTMDDDISTGGTIVSELRYGLEKIIADNPYCKIILITPINARIGSRGTQASNWAYGYDGTITPCGSLKNFSDKLKEVCEYYGIEVIDMTNSSVVNRNSITTVLPDGIHPNLECYKALGHELARKITFA